MDTYPKCQEYGTVFNNGIHFQMTHCEYFGHCQKCNLFCKYRCEKCAGYFCEPCAKILKSKNLIENLAHELQENKE